MRLRQLAGQHLITPADGRTVVRDLCGLQAQFLSNALHALSIRSTGPIPDTLVKSWTIRGTMHLFDQSDLPACIFLAGFDPLMLGYEKKESLYLPPEYLRSIFSLAGIVSPAILLRGRVVGRWKKKNGKLQLTAFEALGADRQIVEEAADRLWPDESLRLQWDERQ